MADVGIDWLSYDLQNSLKDYDYERCIVRRAAWGPQWIISYLYLYVSVRLAAHGGITGAWR